MRRTRTRTRTEDDAGPAQREAPSRMAWLRSQGDFNAWADSQSRWGVRGVTAAMLLLFVTTLLAIVIMGPRLLREAPLLWFGEVARGTIERVKVEGAGNFKDGARRYRVTLDYRFATLDGRSFVGSTERGDVRTLQDFKAGDGIDIHYNRDDPRRSVAAYNLAIDVYALLLFLPFLAVIGVGFGGLYLWRCALWRVGWR